MKYLFLALVLLFTALFIEVTGESMPARVASHFGGSGRANGFMPREAYVRFMIFMAVGVPLFLALVHRMVRLFPTRMINLPNREYWLAPERMAETFDYVENYGVIFATSTAVFLCFVHWMAVLANQSQPPYLPNEWFIAGLVAFMLFTIGWSVALIVHFSRAPDETSANS